MTEQATSSTSRAVQEKQRLGDGVHPVRRRHDDHGRWLPGLTGLVAIFENEFYVSTRNYLLQFDATAGAGSTCSAVCSSCSPASR